MCIDGIIYAMWIAARESRCVTEWYELLSAQLFENCILQHSTKDFPIDCEQSSKRTQELLKNRLVWVRRIFFHFLFLCFSSLLGFCRWRFFGLSWWGRSHIASSRQMGLLCILLNKDLLVCTLESPGHLLISQNHLELDHRFTMSQN